MMLDVLLTVVCLASMSLSATSVPFRWGRCAMKSVRQKRPANSLVIRSLVPEEELCERYLDSLFGHLRALSSA